MSKRFVSMVLALGIVLGMTIPVVAVSQDQLFEESEVVAQQEGRINETENLEDQYLIAYMKSVLQADIKVVSKQALSSLSGGLDYIFYIIEAEGNLGYAILNVNTWEIPECALDHIPPIPINSTTMYGGPLTYIAYNSNSNSYYDVYSNKSISMNEISEIHKLTANSKEATLGNEAKLQQLQTILATSSTIKMIPGAGDTSWLYDTGRYAGDCGLNCIAMVEKYYDKYIDTNCLPNSLSTEQQIKNSIDSYREKYMPGTEKVLLEYEVAELMTQHTRSVGLNSFYLYASDSIYNWRDVVSYIDKDLPMALLVHNAPEYGNHYVVACGYTDTGSTATNRLYLNSGWAQNGFVWLDQKYAYKQIPCVH